MKGTHPMIHVVFLVSVLGRIAKGTPDESATVGLLVATWLAVWAASRWLLGDGHEPETLP